MAIDGLTPGRIVHYVLSEDDAKTINARRKAANAIPDDHKTKGVQYNIGNSVEAGEHCPMVIVKVWNTDGLINGKVFLDGYDDHWVTSRSFSEQKEPFTWHWIEKA